MKTWEWITLFAWGINFGMVVGTPNALAIASVVFLGVVAVMARVASGDK